MSERTVPDDQKPCVAFCLKNSLGGSEKVPMPLDVREPARGADEECARADTQLSPHCVPGSRRPYLARVDSVVNMGQRRWRDRGIIQGLCYALRDRDVGAGGAHDM